MTKKMPLLLLMPQLLVLSTLPLRADLPEYRPALIGTYPKSLINLINAKGLMERGQKDGTVMFETGITELGDGYNSRCYRGSAGTEMLQKEVLGRIDQAQFEPAVYNHTRVGCYMQGTVMFLIHDGKPMLRIFLNQDDNEIKAGHDFIAPQFCFAAGNHAFKWFNEPLLPAGVAVLGMDIDATGHVTGRKVVYEHPADGHYGALVMGHVGDALFVPGFRNGKPVACHFDWTLMFTGARKHYGTG